MIREEDVEMRVETDEEKKDEPSALEPLMKLKMALGNKIHHDSDLPENEIDETDLDLQLDNITTQVFERNIIIFPLKVLIILLNHQKIESV